MKPRTSIRYRQCWDLARRRTYDRRPHTHWLDDKKRYCRQAYGFRAQAHTMDNMKCLHANPRNFQWANESRKQSKAPDLDQDHISQKRSIEEYEFGKELLYLFHSAKLIEIN